jgi:hypothetical protein
MSNPLESENRSAQALTIKQPPPLWAVPAVLGTLMLSSGAFFVLIAHGISILSSVGY